MISVEHVSKTYGKKHNTFTALEDVSFSVKEGTTVAIVGKSGSGKSTLMHIMSGLDRADKGQVLVGERDIQKLNRKQADDFRATEMSFIFQSFFIEGNQTVYQNVALPLEIANVPANKRRTMITEALRSVELLDKAKNRGKDLSGGQKQRLAIARAIVNKPKLIFADEPTGNLDSATGEKVIKLLFDITKKLGSTLFVVTHDADLATRCAVRIQVRDGSILSIDHKKARS